MGATAIIISILAIVISLVAIKISPGTLKRINRKPAPTEISEANEIHTTEESARERPWTDYSLLEQIIAAQVILGEENVFGPREVKKIIFGDGISGGLDGFPLIPFDREELKRAKELGQYLIFRFDKDEDGQILSIDRIIKRFKTHGFDLLRVMLERTSFKKEKFYLEDASTFGWALCGKEFIEGSRNRGYSVETDCLYDYAVSKVFQGLKCSDEYGSAIGDCFQSLMNSSSDEELFHLKFNQLFRRSPVEAFYDLLIYYYRNPDPLPYGQGFRTNALDFEGKNVYLSFNNDGEIQLDSRPLDSSLFNLGVIFSRRG